VREEARQRIEAERAAVQREQAELRAEMVAAAQVRRALSISYLDLYLS